MTDNDGQYRIDSIPPGQHRVVVLHAVLDTLGTLDAHAGDPLRRRTESHELDSRRSDGRSASRARVLQRRRSSTRGPAVLVGFVKDPDTNEPAIGAKVELVFEVDRRHRPQDSRAFAKRTVDSTGTLSHLRPSRPT